MKILEISNRKAWVVTMGEIIEIESNLPHEVQEVVCLKCLHRWIAAYPSRTWLKDLQCKCCEVGYVIATGQILDTNEYESCEDSTEDEDVPDSYSTQHNTNVAGKMFSEDTLLQFINSELYVSTNPTEFEYNDQFEKFMDNPAIMSFGRWMQANGQALAAFTMEDGIRHKIPYLVIGRDI